MARSRGRGHKCNSCSPSRCAARSMGRAGPSSGCDAVRCGTPGCSPAPCRRTPPLPHAQSAADVRPSPRPCADPSQTAPAGCHARPQSLPASPQSFASSGSSSAADGSGWTTMRAEELDDSLLVLQARHEHVEIHSVDPLDRQPDMTAVISATLCAIISLAPVVQVFASRRRFDPCGPIEPGLPELVMNRRSEPQIHTPRRSEAKPR